MITNDEELSKVMKKMQELIDRREILTTKEENKLYELSLEIYDYEVQTMS